MNIICNAIYLGVGAIIITISTAVCFVIIKEVQKINE